MHFNVCVFIPVEKPLDVKASMDDIEGLVCSHIENFNEEFGSGPGRYDWFEVGGRWSNILPSKKGVCDFCMIDSFNPFPRIGKDEKKALRHTYDLITLPREEITEEKRKEALELGRTILSECPWIDTSDIATFDEFVRSEIWYFPYSYVTTDKVWIDQDDVGTKEFNKSFKSYVNSLKKSKNKKVLVVNVDCHI